MRVNKKLYYSITEEDMKLYDDMIGPDRLTLDYIKKQWKTSNVVKVLRVPFVEVPLYVNDEETEVCKKIAAWRLRIGK